MSCLFVRARRGVVQERVGEGSREERAVLLKSKSLEREMMMKTSPKLQSVRGGRHGIFECLCLSRSTPSADSPSHGGRQLSLRSGRGGVRGEECTSYRE